jgi:hypothetical protein
MFYMLHIIYIDVSHSFIQIKSCGVLFKSTRPCGHSDGFEIDHCFWRETTQIFALDPALRALRACPHLQLVVIQTGCASADAMTNLLQLQSATDLHLVLEMDHLLAVTDEIRQGRCNVRSLEFAMHLGGISDTTEAVKAVASAIRLDYNLLCLFLEMDNGFTDEAGVALAEALRVNKTLRKITLSVGSVHTGNRLSNKAALDAPAYGTFNAMLRVKTSLVVELPPFEIDGVNERILESRKQVLIEQRLNQVNRGRLLASRQTTREEYVDALNDLNSYNNNDNDDDDDDDPSVLQVGCINSLLRLNPSVVCMP